MGMRRVQSAPANLAVMAHRTVVHTSHEDDHGVRRTIAVVPARTGEADAISEMVTSVASEAQVTDSTEQLLFFMIVRWVVTFEDIVWANVCQELGRRLAISFVTHHAMLAFWVAVHHVLPAP